MEQAVEILWGGPRNGKENVCGSWVAVLEDKSNTNIRYLIIDKQKLSILPIDINITECCLWKWCKLTYLGVGKQK